jgi:uncharacterized protein (TIGR03435 family)
VKRAFLSLGSVVLLSGAAFGQATDAPPAFDLADVHVSAKVANPNMRGGYIRGGRIEIRTATMVDLIRTAYDVPAERVVGGPSWLDIDRFDVIAAAPAATSQETAKLMLRSLLADRFKLAVRNDTKPLNAYALTVGKGGKPKLKEADGKAPPGCQGQPQNPQPGEVPYAVAACHGLTMEALAQQLPNMAGAYINDPVVDQTGLKGAWDFELKWTARARLAQAGSAGISVFDAVDKQLGLKLELKPIPMPVVVVERVNQKPTENPLGVLTKLPPPPPTEFEVADIKPSLPDGPQSGRIQNGRVDLRGLTLKTLISLAWDINGDDLMAGAPKFSDTAKFDIIATAPVAVANEQQADIDTLRVMLQNLLKERFKLKTHMEDRPVSAYTLLAGKPKLTKANPENRTGCKEGPAVGMKDPRDANPTLSRLVTCQNMSMAQLADQLQNLASGYVHAPVLDSTGIEGSFDFTFNFSPIGIVQGGGGGRGGDGGAPGAAADPSGGVSLPDALNKQLGLKLEMQKRPMPVLVIDHVEEKPTEN